MRRFKGDKTVDHVIPRSKGGKNLAGNRVWCCSLCNRDKDADLLPKYMEKQLIRFRSCIPMVGRVQALKVLLKVMFKLS